MIPPPESPGRSPLGRRRGRGLHGEVVDQLGRMIVTGDPITDGPLAPEELAQRFEVSRTVLREALRSLESKGLITARPNVGTTVRPVTEWNLLDPDVIEWRALSPQEAGQGIELLGLRQVIETFAARLAATTPDPAVRKSLATATLDMEDALRCADPGEFARADARFHRLVVRAGGSLLLDYLAATVARGLHACAEPTTCVRTDASVQRHWAVLDALHHDGKEAERAMRDLLGPAPNLDPHVKKAVVPGQQT